MSTEKYETPSRQNAVRRSLHVGYFPGRLLLVLVASLYAFDELLCE